MPAARPAYSSDPEEIARLRAGFSELHATYTRLQSDHLQQTSDYTRLQQAHASLKRDHLQIRHPLEELKRWVFGRTLCAGSDPDRDPSEGCSDEAARAEAVAGSFAPDRDHPRAGRGSERAQVYRPGSDRDLELDPGPTGGDASGATQVCGSRTGA